MYKSANLSHTIQMATFDLTLRTSRHGRNEEDDTVATDARIDRRKRHIRRQRRISHSTVGPE